jgi:hypothetical protein
LQIISLSKFKEVQLQKVQVIQHKPVRAFSQSNVVIKSGYPILVFIECPVLINHDLALGGMLIKLMKMRALFVQILIGNHSFEHLLSHPM